MVVCVALAPDGEVAQGWGRAARVAVAEVVDGGVRSWEEFDVGWDRLHDQGTEGGHHARIARFLTEHRVEQVVAGHMGPPMQQMLERMGLATKLGAVGDARRAAIAAAWRN